MNFERFETLRTSMLNLMFVFFEKPDHTNKRLILAQLEGMEEELLSTKEGEEGRISGDDLSHAEIALSDLQSSLATCEGESATQKQIKELRNSLRNFLSECKIIELKTKGMKIDSEKWRERRRREKKEEEKEEKISPGEIFKGMTQPGSSEEKEF
ncbi:hypothetical protein AKJ57_03690 [candidate division MSBL1 archaeon SCGC-AAA259A05]|uniref:Uncharacterized protein n=1 Tax=candidate division MSBL1 archaeon SCGC-AAA259A05 TaxID=1698259 RepID=A0A133U9C4_9EURY|nr:hypothetical protein AKJ57_03690 [candidate division MSBL1 archaeon SCGC-AAA259A05]